MVTTKNKDCFDLMVAADFPPPSWFARKVFLFCLEGLA